MNVTKLISAFKRTVLKGKKNKYIVIHYVGGVSTAKNNCIYYGRKDARDASAHYFVDDTGVYQCVEDSNAAWHCGATSYKHKECRNSNSIGIEMCLKKDSSGKLYVTDKTIDLVGQLVRDLMKKYGISESNVIRHYDVTGKSCPNCNGLLNDAKWKAFRSQLCKSISNPTTTSFLIKVANVSKGDKLNIREKPDPNSKLIQKLEYNDPRKYTIVETIKVGTQTWGLLKSGQSNRNKWINLYYTKRV